MVIVYPQVVKQKRFNKETSPPLRNNLKTN